MLEIVISVIVAIIVLQLVFKTFKFIVKLGIFLAIVAVLYYFLSSAQIFL